MEAKENYCTSESENSDEEISDEPKSQPINGKNYLPSEAKSCPENLELPINENISCPKDQSPDQVLSKDSQKEPSKSKFKVDSLAYYKDQARSLGIKGFSKKSKKVLKELVAKKLNPEQVSSINSEEVSKDVESSTNLSSKSLDPDTNSGQETSKDVDTKAKETAINSQLNSQLCDQLRQMCRDCSPKITISKYDSSLKMTRPKNKKELIEDLTKYCLNH